MDIVSIFGTIAAICMILGYLPQAVTTIRTRDTDGISMMTFSMMGFGSLFFVIQGILGGNWPLVVTNVITGTCSLIISIIKISNDLHRRRK